MEIKFCSFLARLKEQETSLDLIQSSTLLDTELWFYDSLKIVSSFQLYEVLNREMGLSKIPVNRHTSLWRLP